MMEITEKFQGGINERAKILFAENQQEIFRYTDRLFVRLMIFQWLFGIVLAIWVSPRTWTGQFSQTHIHVWAAIFLGGVISFFPIMLGILKPGQTITRYVIASGQMLMGALLIHLSGGRIETHFHIFGSLAFLAFYRDWKVFIPATIIVAADHFVRGVFWPQSVFGVLTAQPWRWIEHAAWVVFENIFLVRSCRRSVEEMKSMAERTAQLEMQNQIVEAKVTERTQELADVNYELNKEIVERKNIGLELKRKIEDLQEYKRVTVGREEKMIELKKEINKLSEETGKSSPYDLT